MYNIYEKNKTWFNRQTSPEYTILISTNKNSRSIYFFQKAAPSDTAEHELIQRRENI